MVKDELDKNWCKDIEMLGVAGGRYTVRRFMLPKEFLSTAFAELLHFRMLKDYDTADAIRAKLLSIGDNMRISFFQSEAMFSGHYYDKDGAYSPIFISASLPLFCSQQL